MNNFESSYSSETVAAQIRGQYGHLDAEALLRVMIEEQFNGKIMLSSSFGAESALLLSMVARIDSAVPVLFMDTRRLFGETLRYQKQLTDHFGLEDVRVLRPDEGLLQRLDADDMLFAHDSDKCCEIRKILPLDKQMKLLKEQGFKGWITGRKQFQSQTRDALKTVEAQGILSRSTPWPIGLRKISSRLISLRICRPTLLSPMVSSPSAACPAPHPWRLGPMTGPDAGPT